MGTVDRERFRRSDCLLFVGHENSFAVRLFVAAAVVVVDASAESVDAGAYFERAVERIVDFGDAGSDEAIAEDFGNFDATTDARLLLAVATDRLSSLVCHDSEFHNLEKDVGLESSTEYYRKAEDVFVITIHGLRFFRGKKEMERKVKTVGIKIEQESKFKKYAFEM